jgi:hypothetical protein
MTDPDADLDKAVVSKARDGLARARSRLAKAEDGEAKVAAEKSVAVWAALLQKALAAPHQAKARKQERATMWAALRHLTDVAEEQGRGQQQMQAGLQQLQAAVQSLATAIEADRPARDEVNAAIGQFYRDPQGAALAALARHRTEDAAKEKRSLESATKKWESKRTELESDLARGQKLLDRFNHDHDIEPDPIRRRALTKHLTGMMAAHMAVMDRLGEHLDQRPH